MDTTHVPKLIIITAPSGGGKTTVVRHLLQSFPEQLAFSISATTRPRRAHETDGQDYYFLDQTEFARLVEEGGFIEWEEVYEGRFYGTLRSEVERLWAAGKHVIFDVDVKGAMTLMSQWPERTLAIFLRPPSLEVLFKRLDDRRTEDAESLRRRKDRAEYEMAQADQFDVVIVNDELDYTLELSTRLVHRFITESSKKACD